MKIEKKENMISRKLSQNQLPMLHFFFFFTIKLVQFISKTKCLYLVKIKHKMQLAVIE